MTWDRRLYFPSEGRRAEDFFRPKNPTALAGFEPTNLGTNGQHATPRPPKPLNGKYNMRKTLAADTHTTEDCHFTCMKLNIKLQ